VEAYVTISTRKRALAALVATGVAIALAGCGAAPETGDGGDAGGETIDFLPCIVSDMGGFDDKSFNQLSFEGAQKAADELGVSLKDVQSNAETEYGPNVTNLVGEGCNAIVAVGFALSAATVEAATANPDVDFILVDDAADNDFDGKKDADNVKPLLYDTAQAAFLAGYLSAGYSKTGKVGTFGGQEFPTVTIFMDGFKQGVDHYNEVKGTDVKVVGWDGKTGSFTGGFEANQDAKQVAVNILDQGVDVILPVGGPIYQSAQQAIKESGKDIALTSVLKAMDLSTYEAVLASGKGEFDPEAYIGTLENDGVGIADLHNFADKVDSGLQDEVAQLQQDIIDGKVTVTSYLSE
jgi:basic membrane protein A